MSSALNKGLFFQYQKTRIQVLCDAGEVEEKLGNWFSHFLVKEDASFESVKYHHTLRLFLREKAGFASAPLGALSFRRGKFWGWLRPRKVLYENGGSLILKRSGKKKKVMEITMPTADLLAQLAFLLIQALWGEDLEREGYLRIHALTYQRQGRAGLVCADSGLGKSTMALKLLERHDVEVLSDEIAWIKDGLVYAYPIPVWEKPAMAGESKRAHFLPQGFSLAGFPLEEVFCVFHGKEAKDASPFALKRKFLRKMVVGHHLPQMTEIFLRGNNLMFLTGLFFRRFLAGVRLILASRVTYLVTEDYLPYERLISESRVIGTSLFDQSV